MQFDLTVTNDYRAAAEMISLVITVLVMSGVQLFTGAPLTCTSVLSQPWWCQWWSPFHLPLLRVWVRSWCLCCCMPRYQPSVCVCFSVWGVKRISVGITDSGVRAVAGKRPSYSSTLYSEQMPCARCPRQVAAKARTQSVEVLVADPAMHLKWKLSMGLIVVRALVQVTHPLPGGFTWLVMGTSGCRSIGRGKKVETRCDKRTRTEHDNLAMIEAWTPSHMTILHVCLFVLHI